MNDKAPAGKAYRNITRRIMGENVPLMELEDESGLAAMFKKLLKGK